METQITIRQVELSINIDPSTVIVFDEMEKVLDTQHNIHMFMTIAIGLDCKQPRNKKRSI
ncbi:hypothetical protein MHH28_11290 [Paenibacillus sp. FSL K6-1217]|uniref:hypothetical protein n=1 Tax=Paenibacillus sp. FSL K6-1217 TaxID=2921466 RepID=UPI00324A6133